MRRRLLLLAALTALALPRCACEPPDIQPPGDAGEGEGEGEADAGPNAGDAGPVDAGPPPTPVELARELCLALRAGLVNHTLQLLQASPPPRCAPTDPIDDVAQLGAGLTPGDCTQVDPLFRALEASVREARVAVDPDQLAACQAAGRALRAEHDTQAEYDARVAALDALAAAPACQGVVEPLLSQGDACANTLECPAGTRCEADPLDSAVLSCIAPALEGQRCEDRPVGDALPIRTCASELVCVLNLCTRPGLQGQSCGQVPCAAGLVCGADQLCAPPDPGDAGPGPVLDGEPCELGGPPCAARCSLCRPVPDGDAGVGRVCLPPGDLGELCESELQCARGLRCNAGACAPRVGLDEPCAPGACAEGLACVSADGGQTCQPLATLGEACLDRPCAEGFCTEGECRAGVAQDPCGSDASCDSAHLCVTNVCVVAPREGAPCTDDGRCEAGLLCINDRCRAPPGAGDPCFGDAGICDDEAFCEDGSCVAKGDPGAACTSAEQCLSGRCLDTLTCAAEGASCLSGTGTFAQLLGLSGVFALLGLRRRRRASLRPRA